MYEQFMMDAVDRAEKLLVETRDTVSKICCGLRDDIEEKDRIRVATWHIKEAFKDKHGMGMAKYREQQVGVKNGEVIREANEEAKAPVIALAKRLLENTSFNVGEVGRFCGLLGNGLSGVFKRFDLPSPRQYRRDNANKVNTYTQQKAERKRIHINGGMRLSQQRRSSVMAWTKLHDHVGTDQAVLSVSITGLGFDVVIPTHRERVTVNSAITVKTGFITPLKDTYSESEEVVVRLNNGDEVSVKCNYDCLACALGIEVIGHYVPSAIEFTALITTTEL